MDNATLINKSQQFLRLHQQDEIFDIPNPWDVGSALMLEKVGALALTTSSGASAAAMGLKDGQLGRDAVLVHCRDIAAATTIPLNADLENGFSHEPAGVAETLQLASTTGLVGASIEDFGGADEGIYSLDLAVARIRAAAEVTRNLPFPFLLTARAENYFRGIDNLDDTITRLTAYEAAGADVLFAPGLPDLDSVRAVCQAVKVPVNFLVSYPGKSFSRDELAQAGVKRISYGTLFYRRAMAAAEESARAVLTTGVYGLD